MLIPKRRFYRVFAPAGLMLMALGLTSTGFAQSQAAPDNSRSNKVQNRSQTAEQQDNKASDRELTAKIRRAVVADKSLSTYGHNVKIMVAQGVVTLKGPVHSEEEKQSIAAKATQIAGQDKVTNGLTVKQ